VAAGSHRGLGRFVPGRRARGASARSLQCGGSPTPESYPRFISLVALRSENNFLRILSVARQLAANRSQPCGPSYPLGLWLYSSYRSDTGHPDTKLRRVSGWRLNSPESRRSRKSNKRPTCSTPILCAAKTPAIDSDTNTDIAYLLVALIAAVVRHTRNKHLDKLNVLGPGDSITLRPKASPSPNFQTHNRPPPPPRGYAMAYHPNPPGLECLASNVAHGRI